MKKLFTVALILVSVILVGCGGKENVAVDLKETVAEKNATSKITRSEAQAKLLMLSEGLEVYHDDMKEFTLCRCHYDVSDRRIAIVPYVILKDNDYSIALGYHVLYCGRDPLHFDTIYIKTTDGVEHFKYKNVSILYGRYVVEEYKGAMSNEVYAVLKKAVASGYAKIRLEGRQMDERELSQSELTDFGKVFAIYEFFSKVKVE